MSYRDRGDYGRGGSDYGRDRGGGYESRGGGGGYEGRGSGQPRRISLLVRNLPIDASMDDVRAMFERYGEIRDVYLPRDYYTQRPKGFGFVEFRDSRDAEEALYKLDRSMYGGREISVVMSKESRKTPREMLRREDTEKGYRPSSGSGRGRDRHSRSRSRSRSRGRSYSRSPPRKDRRESRERSRSASPRRDDQDAGDRAPRERSISPRRNDDRSPSRSG